MTIGIFYTDQQPPAYDDIHHEINQTPPSYTEIHFDVGQSDHAYSAASSQRSLPSYESVVEVSIQPESCQQNRNFNKCCKIFFATLGISCFVSAMIIIIIAVERG